MQPFFDVPWCNGSTPDFGSVCPGSSPGGTTTGTHARVLFFLQNNLMIELFFPLEKQIEFNKMNWLILIIAGLCETGFAFCLGKSKLAVSTEYWMWISGFAVLYVLSAVLLAKATQTIPIGIAYPVWTGIGAVGTVLLGILVFHEPATFWRMFFLSTLILSIVGIKIVG